MHPAPDSARLQVSSIKSTSIQKNITEQFIVTKKEDKHQAAALNTYYLIKYMYLPH